MTKDDLPPLPAESRCILWPGHITEAGYGRIMRRPGKSEKAHVTVWVSLNGPVPDGMELDHKCRNRACINPAHLEPVTHKENTLRGIGPTAINARKTECKRGHKLSGENVYICPRGHRLCRECQVDRDKAYKNKLRAGAQA